MSKTSINSIDDILTKDVKLTDVIEEVLSDEKNRELFSNAYKIVISTPDIMSNLLYKGDSTRSFLLKVVKEIGELLAPHFNYSEGGDLYVCYLKDPETGELVPFTRERYEKWKPLFMFTYLFDIDNVDRELVPTKCRDPPFWVLMNKKPYIGFSDEKTFQERVKQGVLLPDYLLGMEIARKITLISSLYGFIGDYKKKKEFQDKYAAIKKKAYQESKTVQVDPNITSENEKLIEEEIKSIKQMFPNYDELYNNVIKTYPYLKDVFSNSNIIGFPIGDSIVFFFCGINDPFPPAIDKIKLGWVVTSLLTIPFYSANLINEIEKKNRELAKANETITRMKEREKKVEAINAQQKLIGEQLHDIKNMLSPVRGRFEIIKKLSENIIWKEGTTETQKRIYNNSLVEGTESAKNLYDYLDGLGDFLNINEGHKKDVELSELLKKLEDDYLPLFNEKKINLVFNVKDKALVFVDPNILYRKVFMNLMQNILEHSSATEASVTLELREEVDNKYAVVIFLDNGRGMSKETLDEIVVLQRSTKATAYEGSRLRGLGFPSAVKATSLYNGYVDVFSEFGKGSKFEVYLPLKKDKNDG